MSLKKIECVLVPNLLFFFKYAKKLPDPWYTPFKGNSEEKSFLFFVKGLGSFVSLLLLRAFKLHYEQNSYDNSKARAVKSKVVRKPRK